MHYSAACGISLALPLGLGALCQRISRVPGSSQASIQGHSSQLEGKQQWSNRNGFYIFMSQAFLLTCGWGYSAVLWSGFAFAVKGFSQTQKQAGAGHCLRVYVQLQCSIEYPGSSPSTDWFCQLLLGVTRPFSGGWRLSRRSGASGALAGILGTSDALQWRLLWVWLEHSSVFAAQTQPNTCPLCWFPAAESTLEVQQYFPISWVSGQGLSVLGFCFRAPEFSPDPPWAAEPRVLQLSVSPVGKVVLEPGTLLLDELRSYTKREWIFLFVSFVFVYLIQK